MAAELTTKPAAKPNPNARLISYRKYHTWFGLFAGVFLVMLAVTGIYLNHKDVFRPWLGGVSKADENRGLNGKPGLPSAGEIASLPVSFVQAVELAAPHMGDRPVERIELKAEHGRLVYRIKAIDGPEVVINSQDGSTEIKGGAKPLKTKDKSKVDAPTAAVSTASYGSATGFDWGKAIKDLHTGKIGGEAGKLLIDFVAVVLIVLTLTGVYLWIVPELRKRKSAKKRQEATQKNPVLA